MKNATLFLISLLLSTLCSCEKNDTAGPDPGNPYENIQPIAPPKKIEVIRGNNQYGFCERELPDTICIEIIPQDIKDVDNYFYFTPYNITVHETEKKEDRIIMKLVWRPYFKENEKQTTTDFHIYSLHDFTYIPVPVPIASVTLSASMKEPWTVVLTKTTSTGPGDFWDIHFSDNHNGIAVGDYFLGNAITTDGGKTWEYRDQSYRSLYLLSFYDNLNGIAVGVNNYACFTNDGGKTFYEGPWTPPIVGHLSSSDYYMVDKNLIFTVGSNGTIAKSTDAGKSWKPYDGFKFQNRLNAITCISNNICIACGDIGKIVRTTDGGDTWTDLDLLLNNDLEVVYFFDDKTGFIGGDYGVIVKTNDGGETWDIINTGLIFSIIEIHFLTPQTGYVATTCGEIARTDDGGQTWKLVNIDNYGVHSLNKIYFKDSTTLFGLQNGNIYTYKIENH